MNFPAKQFRAPVLTVSRKITFGYLLMSLFSLAAVIYVLHALDDQADFSRQLVRVEFPTLILAQELSRNLLAQERVERQALILKDPALLEIYHNLRKEYAGLRQTLAHLSTDDLFDKAPDAKIEDMSGRLLMLLEQKQWQEGAAFSRKELFPLRESRLEQIKKLQQQLRITLDAALQTLPEKSQQAYQRTMILFFLGLLLSSLVAGRLLYKFNHSLRVLTQAIHRISEGDYDIPLPVPDNRDEFGQLAKEFSVMAAKLKELEQLSLDASPLTYLPGNRRIEQELQMRVEKGVCFSHIYIDLDNFKAYNDRYGFQTGSKVIFHTGQIIQKVVSELGNHDDLVGHVGGDDYVVLSTPECAEPIAQRIIAEFDRTIPDFYSEKDQKNGYFSAADRFGTVRHFPLLTVSIVCVNSGNLKEPSPQSIARECVKLKRYLKNKPGSNYRLDRRSNR